MFFFPHSWERKPVINKCWDGIQDWDEDKIKFDYRLRVRASTYRPLRLFDVKPVDRDNADSEKLARRYHRTSPGGLFRYTEMILPKGHWLDMRQGRKAGHVCFDADISIPRINERSGNCSRFDCTPWMSYTPQEILTQRYGVRRAKGVVVVAGLGMGWLLKKVMERDKVEKVILVEISQELLDWVMPQLKLADKSLKVVCDDACKAVPKMTADVALVDIFPGYGYNSFTRCPNIDYVWCWGSCNTGV